MAEFWQKFESEAEISPEFLVASVKFYRHNVLPNFGLPIFITLKGKFLLRIQISKIFD